MQITKKLQSRLIRFCKQDFSISNCRTLHFTFILNRNKVVSMGWNNARKTHPMANKYGHRFNCIHSELHAINNLDWPANRFSQLSIVNIRLKKDGTFGLALPCVYCKSLLSDLGFREIYFTDNSGSFLRDGV